LAVLSLLPASNLAAQFIPSADRFLYLPLAGLALAVAPPLAGGLSALSRPWARLAAGVTVAFVLAALGLRSLAWMRVWDNDRALWDATLAASPFSFNALYGCGSVRFEAGETEAAAAYWRELARRHPDSGLALALAAMGEHEVGRLAEAVRLFRKASELEPALRDPVRYARFYFWKPRARATLDLLIRATPPDDG
jgi:tetratricopeptide (TPR) repeat protein